LKISANNYKYQKGKKEGKQNKKDTQKEKIK
jgi:hypothetical protein